MASWDSSQHWLPPLLVAPSELFIHLSHASPKRPLSANPLEQSWYPPDNCDGLASDPPIHPPLLSHLGSDRLSLITHVSAQSPLPSHLWQMLKTLHVLALSHLPSFTSLPDPCMQRLCPPDILTSYHSLPHPTPRHSSGSTGFFPPSFWQTCIHPWRLWSPQLLYSPLKALISSA